MLNYQALVEKVFAVRADHFDKLALEIFHFQYNHNSIYRQYVDHIGVSPQSISSPLHIPFLPVSFFKTHEVIADSVHPQVVFSSSATTGDVPSRHLVADVSLYEKSFLDTFRQFYGPPEEWAILCLLPSYLEREGSSLVYMAEQLARLTGDDRSGFFLNDIEDLSRKLTACEREEKKTLLLGVTFALLDLAEKHPQPLRHTVVMETGGMKGKREEMVREEVHDILQRAFHVDSIHSEYGMTELLSQAYSQGEGIFCTPAWMKVYAGDLYDPMETKASGRGTLRVIDLANLLSCSFIATDDMGEVMKDGRFSVLGRSDNSDVRGCNLMVASP